MTNPETYPVTAFAPAPPGWYVMPADHNPDPWTDTTPALPVVGWMTVQHPNGKTGQIPAVFDTIMAIAATDYFADKAGNPRPVMVYNLTD